MEDVWKENSLYHQFDQGELDMHSIDDLVVCLGESNGHIGRHIDGFDDIHKSILGFFTVGMTTLSMLSVSCVLYSAGSGVKRVLVVLSGLRWSWFCCVHEAISCKYGCSFACAICLFVSVDVIVMSSA